MWPLSMPGNPAIGPNLTGTTTAWRVSLTGDVVRISVWFDAAAQFLLLRVGIIAIAALAKVRAGKYTPTSDSG